MRVFDVGQEEHLHDVAEHGQAKHLQEPGYELKHGYILRGAGCYLKAAAHHAGAIHPSIAHSVPAEHVNVA